MLPEKRITRRQSAKKKKPIDELPKYRETPMTQPEPRYYKEVFRTDKNIAQMGSTTNPIRHDAPMPAADPRANVKQTARMMKSNFEMNP